MSPLCRSFQSGDPQRVLRCFDFQIPPSLIVPDGQLAVNCGNSRANRPEEAAENLPLVSRLFLVRIFNSPPPPPASPVFAQLSRDPPEIARSRSFLHVQRDRRSAHFRKFGRFLAIPLRHNANRVPSPYYRYKRFKCVSQPCSEKTPRIERRR
jgi:hypothetical protein